MYAVIMLRSNVGVKKPIKDTLELLRLHKINHCVFLDENEYNKGMLQKVKDFVAWGEVDKETLMTIMEERGRLIGNIRLKDVSLEDTSFGSLDLFVEALLSGKANFNDIPTLKPVFRLHPPRKGHKGIKKSFKAGGELGYHGDKINDLLLKMR
ncbi:MAG TPA: 50S ribosomal protein L30 [Halobacteria archaeon]|jgi:large subunit ribosomal protein L30|nr:50S ribosomal protein L30 [Halobacteria archaeon]HIH77400.1 50S ribosomal protein L30 [Halobacteria archaeon]